MMTFEQWAAKDAPFLLDSHESGDEGGKLARVVARRAWEAGLLEGDPEREPAGWFIKLTVAPGEPDAYVQVKPEHAGQPFAIALYRKKS